jgi:hypothetical protein
VADEAAGGSGGGDGGIRGTAVTVGAWGRKLTDSPVCHTILMSSRARQLLQPAGMWPVNGAASARRAFCSDRTAPTGPEKRPNGRKVQAAPATRLRLASLRGPSVSASTGPDRACARGLSSAGMWCGSAAVPAQGGQVCHPGRDPSGQLRRDELIAL